MLHTASLVHDVIDASPLPRGAPAKFGSKLSVLGRASTALARLGDVEVTQLIASVISNLAEGEILASVMAKGARSAVVLGGCEEGGLWKDIANAYGRNLGISGGLFGFAFFLPFLLPIPNCPSSQLINDILEYESTSTPGSADLTLDKPGGADLQLDLATGPALYAWEEFPEMGELIGRKFEGPGDVEMARSLVLRSSGVHRTKLLTTSFAEKPRRKEVLGELPESVAKARLVALTERVVGRRS
ncbi:hypothetical protein K443DRAFT_113392 [Laccaria amethystina LaAM-08-1]|uniref:Uncharacterized protein n=1 Tax=Laccaria amethystina LaAM-08-1 TaxID=1095629 RepID=A0A0C9X4M1_9AGAR|nr:hypothetical protein K443DRAFT_113392 [Laccaria amethystina LaAM-08-1]